MAWLGPNTLTCRQRSMNVPRMDPVQVATSDGRCTMWTPTVSSDRRRRRACRRRRWLAARRLGVRGARSGRAVAICGRRQRSTPGGGGGGGGWAAGWTLGLAGDPWRRAPKCGSAWPGNSFCFCFGRGWGSVAKRPWSVSIGLAIPNVWSRFDGGKKYDRGRDINNYWWLMMRHSR